MQLVKVKASVIATIVWLVIKIQEIYFKVVKFGFFSFFLLLHLN